MRVIPLLSLGLLVTACGIGPTAESVARARAANEFHCPPDQIQTRVISEPTIHVSACGNDVTYTCPPEYYGRYANYTRSCIREDRTAEDGNARAAAAASTDELVTLCQKGNQFKSICTPACQSATKAADGGECKTQSDAARSAIRADPASRSLKECMVACDPSYEEDCQASDNCDCSRKCFGALSTTVLLAINEELRCRIHVETRTPSCR